MIEGGTNPNNVLDTKNKRTYKTIQAKKASIEYMIKYLMSSFP